jgi:hypothetical protein
MPAEVEEGRFQKFEILELTAASPSKAIAADIFLTNRLNGEIDPTETSRDVATC